MAKEDFVTATEFFLSNIRKRTTDDEGLPLSSSNIHSFKFFAEKPGTMYVKFSVHSDPIPVNIIKHGRPAEIQLKSKYTEPLKIDSKKIKDLQDL